MGALERCEIVVVPADQIRRHRQQLEIRALQRRRLIGARERLVGIRPGAPLVAGTASFELAGRMGAGALRVASIEWAHPLASDRRRT